MQDLDRFLKKFFDDITIDRGRAYAESGAVVDLKDNGREIAALVSGTRRSPYRVLVTLSRSGGLPELGSAVCSCPMRFRCKHIVATILTYYGDVPWGSFERTALKRPPVSRVRTTKDILEEIGRLVTRPVQQPDFILPIERPATIRPMSIVRELLPDKPAIGSGVRSERWRLAFVAGARPLGEWRHLPWSGTGRAPRASLRAASQYLRKDGTPGRIERFRADVTHEPCSAAAGKLLRNLAIEGGESPLLLHLDFLIEHPGLPLYAAGPDGRGSFDHPLELRRITRIRIGFEPELAADGLGGDVHLLPVVRVDLESDEAAAQRVAWIDSAQGRLIACLGGRWLGWCEGDDRLLSLVRLLDADQPPLGVQDVAELKEKVPAENDPLVTVDFPYRRLKVVTRRPRTDLLLHEEDGESGALLSFEYTDEGRNAEGAGDEKIVVRPDAALEQRITASLGQLFDAGALKGTRLPAPSKRRPCGSLRVRPRSSWWPTASRCSRAASDCASRTPPTASPAREPR